MFILKNANSEGLLRLKHLLNNTRKSSGCYLKVHKYGPGMPVFILKFPLSKQGPADIIISHLAYFTSGYKCYISQVWPLTTMSLKPQFF